MKIRILGLLIAGVLTAAQPALAQTPVDAPPTRLAFDNIADDFLAFWDATRDLPTPERVAAFKRDVAPLFPEFYGIERFGGRTTQEQLDQRLASSIEGFAAIRDAYASKLQAFDASLTENLGSFLIAFPDFRPTIEVHLLHSLGEMDGGIRALGGKAHLIFGADVMVRSLAGARDTPFFHHELFHVHHSATFNGCGQEVWCRLWREGLAVHVADQLNAGATPQELLLAYPLDLAPRTDARIGDAWAHLNSVMTSTDREVAAGLFQMRDDGTGLPIRRGYYLGYLVAKRLGADRDLKTLASLSVEEARPLVFAAVAELAAEHPVRSTSAP